MLSVPALTPTRAVLVVRVTNTLSAVWLVLGILGILRSSGQARIGADAPDLTLVVFTVHPVSSTLHLVLGLAGVLAARRASSARLYLLALAGLLVVWALAGLIAQGSPGNALTGDAEVITLYLVTAAVAAAAVLLPERPERTRDADAPTPEPGADRPA